MKTFIRTIFTLILSAALITMCGLTVFADGTEDVKDTDAVETVDDAATNENDVSSAKAYAAAIVIGLAASAGAIAMGMTIAKSSEGISRQPEAAGSIRSSMMLGLVFIETAIIYALIVAILIIFVL